MSVNKHGFYTALGTPLDKNGHLIESSIKKHVEDQIAAGASGLLALGSMGIQPYMLGSECLKAARAVTEVARERLPVFVGVMDNSVARVLERIDDLKGLKIDGVVATTPYYYTLMQEDVKSFYRLIAERSSFPLYLYDLPGVTKTKITTTIAEELSKDVNIRGIKTGDLATARELSLRCDMDRFSVFFSGLDLFDVAWTYGIRMNLDGMFSCTAKLATDMYNSLALGNTHHGVKCLNSILALRNKLFEIGIFKGFTCLMNILGFEGSFMPDYIANPIEKDYDFVRQCMKECKVM